MRSAIDKRETAILKELTERDSITVEELSSILNVSQMTIRRDLNRMDDDGLLKRTRGGAVPKKESKEFALSENFTTNVTLKNAIALQAANLIQDDDTVFMNNGSTNACILPHIKDKHVRIVTNNSLLSFSEREPIVDIILLGGECRFSSKAMVGELTLSNIDNMRSSLTLLGTNGFDPDSGCYTSSFQESIVNSKMIEKSFGKVVIVADSSKIGRKSNFFFCDCSQIDILITDEKADESLLSRIREQGVRVITAVLDDK